MSMCHVFGPPCQVIKMTNNCNCFSRNGAGSVVKSTLGTNSVHLLSFVKKTWLLMKVTERTLIEDTDPQLSSTRHDLSINKRIES